VRNFVADLLRGGTSVKEAKRHADNTYRNKGLKTRAIYKILIQIKDGKNTDNGRKFNSKKTIHAADLIAAIAAVVVADRRICTKALASAHGVSAGTVLTILHKELGIVKKSARCVPKLLSQVQMERRVETSAAFIKMVQDKGRSILGKIVTMNE
jgi:hypothetical protein